ncbi:MAG: PD40 domain-containing protein [Krumholzibacteria bacterium]|nr:PD40 domain-containing protein [Candidatus Krumholzibacteria bacterium]
MKRLIPAFLAACLPATALPASAQDAPGYVMRHADVGGGHVVFTYEDDLWLVPVDGGQARRITAHPGTEQYAKISPDGTRLAFTGEYDGGADVYVMDLGGGVPVRLTWHPGYDQVLDWTPDGKGVLFRANRRAPMGAPEVYRVEVTGGMPVELPLDQAALVSMAPDGSAVAYNRIAREARTWKRYEGGMAQDIWLAKFADGSITRITDWPGTDQFPMWMGKTIYFNSDREDGTLNIHGWDTATGEVRRLTTFKDYDVKFPSCGDGLIVFQHGAGLKLLDTATGRTRPLPVTIPSDRRHVRTELVAPAPTKGSFGLSPAGERVLLEARGEILSLPADDGDPVNLTRAPDSREKNAAWSPRGDQVVFCSDRTGEEQLYLLDQRGEGKWRQLTDGFFGFTLPPVWSPDGKSILFADKFMRLHLVDVGSRKLKTIAQGGWDDAWERWGIQDYVWSPDSRWVAFTENTANMHEVIRLYDTKSGDTFAVTDDLATSWSPSFSRDGSLLYFLSNRTFAPIMGRQDQNHVFLKMARPYAVILRAGERSPFHEEDAAVAIAAADAGKDQPDAQKEAAPDGGTVVDTAGLAARIVACAGVEAANWFRLEAIDGGFLLLRKDEPEFLKYQNVNDHTGGRLELAKYDLQEQKTEDILGGIANYHLSADGKKLVYRAGSQYGVLDAAKGGKTGDGKVDPGALKLRVDRLAEFAQIFAEAWRIQRDWFYDEDMHGVDWQATYDKYQPFVQGCGTRGDLNYLIGEMIAELNIGHTYIFGGDSGDGADRVPTGLLGCDFAAEEGADFYRISHIVPGVPWDPDYRSPLAEPGVPVKAGDWLIAIDGVEVRKGDNVYAHLEDKAGTMVAVTTNGRPTAEGAVTTRVRTLTSENGLRYRSWSDANLAYVTEKTGGRIGYLHLPNMMEPGLVEFGRLFYPQTGRQALIIDERWNGGGFVGDMIIDRLERELWAITAPREGGTGRNPERVLHGPVVVLINENTGSNGEFFAEAVKRRQLATVMGVRTWGGSIGIEPHQDLVDGGGTTPPQFGLYALDSTWPIEGWGVEPDILVLNLPADVVAGRDTQLDAAIVHLLERLEQEKDTWRIPPTPPYPDKSKPRMSGLR